MFSPIGPSPLSGLPYHSRSYSPSSSSMPVDRPNSAFAPIIADFSRPPMVPRSYSLSNCDHVIIAPTPQKASPLLPCLLSHAQSLSPTKPGNQQGVDINKEMERSVVTDFESACQELISILYTGSSTASIPVPTLVLSEGCNSTESPQEVKLIHHRLHPFGNGHVVTSVANIGVSGNHSKPMVATLKKSVGRSLSPISRISNPLPLNSPFLYNRDDSAARFPDSKNQTSSFAADVVQAPPKGGFKKFLKIQGQPRARSLSVGQRRIVYGTV